MRLKNKQWKRWVNKSLAFMKEHKWALLIISVAIIYRIIFRYYHFDYIDWDGMIVKAVSEHFIETGEFSINVNCFSGPNLRFTGIFGEVLINIVIFSVFGSNLWSYYSLAIFVTAIFLYVTYLFTRKYFSKSIALITILLLSFGPLYFVRFGVQPYYGYWAALINIGIMHFFFKILKDSNWKDYLWLGILCGVGFFNGHFVIPMLITIVILGLYFNRKAIFNSKIFLVLIPFIIINLEKILFMIKNKYYFVELSRFGAAKFSLPSIIHLFDIFGFCTKHGFCEQIGIGHLILSFTFLAAMAFVIFYTIRNKKSHFRQMNILMLSYIFIAFLMVLLLFNAIPKYLVILFPFASIIIAQPISMIKIKHLKIIILAILIIIPIAQFIFPVNAESLYSSSYKDYKNSNYDKMSVEPERYQELSRFFYKSFIDDVHAIPFFLPLEEFNDSIDVHNPELERVGENENISCVLFCRDEESDKFEQYLNEKDITYSAKKKPFFELTPGLNIVGIYYNFGRYIDPNIINELNKIQEKAPSASTPKGQMVIILDRISDALNNILGTGG